MEKHEINFYKNLAENFRNTPRQIGYGSVKSQELRFYSIINVLKNLCNKLNKKIDDLVVLDFGCGRGDFCNYINCKKYYGVDAIEENINDAISKNYKNNVEFKLLNWDGKGNIFRERPDVIIFSGCFATTAPEKRNDLFVKLLKCNWACPLVCILWSCWIIFDS